MGEVRRQLKLQLAPGGWLASRWPTAVFGLKGCEVTPSLQTALPGLRQIVSGTLCLGHPLVRLEVADARAGAVVGLGSAGGEVGEGWKLPTQGRVP